MRAYSLTHLPDAALMRDLAAAASRERTVTATVLAHIAEVDVRRLYLPAGFTSMHAWCVDVLHLSEDAAYKRIQAARAARRFPVIFAAIADSRLHLTAVVSIAPYLTDRNVEELIAAATHLRTADIQRMLAQRFARPAVGAAAPVPTTVVRPVLPPPPHLAEQLVSRPVEATAAMGSRPALPIDPAGSPDSQEYVLRFHVGKRVYDKWLHVQALLSHAIPSGDGAEVLERALDSLVQVCEKQKFGGGSASRACARPSRAPRHIPAAVKRLVWRRDGGRCTFVGTSGRGCDSRRFLEFDHVVPVARGGRATPDNLRIRCRAHNGHEADRVFGTEHMRRKRHVAKQKAGARIEAAEAAALAQAAPS